MIDLNLKSNAKTLLEGARVLITASERVKWDAIEVQLMETVRKLDREVADLEVERNDWRRRALTRAKYVQGRTPVGALVYVQRDSEDSTADPVYVCPTCFEADTISYLVATPRRGVCMCPVHQQPIGVTTRPFPDGVVQLSEPPVFT